MPHGWVEAPRERNIGRWTRQRRGTRDRELAAVIAPLPRWIRRQVA